jgi:aspartate/methionine/tyrosine aminotransferase
LAQLTAALRPETKLVSITVPHNPTGTVLSAADIKAIAALLAQRNIRLLVDETYRDLLPTGTTPGAWAASIGPHVISVGSMSKVGMSFVLLGSDMVSYFGQAYGLPGLRVGWLLCRDPALQELFLAAKEQIQLCGPIIEEEISYQVRAFHR